MPLHLDITMMTGKKDLKADTMILPGTIDGTLAVGSTMIVMREITRVTTIVIVVRKRIVKGGNGVRGKQGLQLMMMISSISEN